MEENSMWNKIVLIIVIASSMILISGCSKENEIIKVDMIGDYTYSECVYLNPLSSATIWGYNGSNNKNMASFIIGETELIIYDSENEIVEEFYDVEYVEVDLDLDIDNMISLMLPDFLDTVEHRYDIYSDGKRIEYIIYMNDEEIFIAELNYLGGTSTASSIWAVFRIE